MNKAQKFLLDNNLDDIVLNEKQYPENTPENANKWIYLSDILEQYLAHNQALLKVWNETEQEQLRIAAVIKSLPDSDEIRMKARELDEKDFDQWWWETVYKGNVL